MSISSRACPSRGPGVTHTNMTCSFSPGDGHVRAPPPSSAEFATSLFSKPREAEKRFFQNLKKHARARSGVKRLSMSRVCSGGGGGDVLVGSSSLTDTAFSLAQLQDKDWYRSHANMHAS